jgi:PAS domain-containing protein
VIWTTPPGAGDATPDGNAAFEPRRRAALDAAREKRELAASRPVDLVTGGKGTIVLVPVFVRDELAGYVAGVFRYQLLFQNLLASNPSPRYSIAVHDGEEPVFALGSASRSDRIARIAAMSVGGLKWELRTAPTEAVVLQARSPVGGVLLVGGGFLAVLFTILTYLIQRPRSRAGFNPAMAAPVLAADFDNIGCLPVVSYRRDGTALAWNDAARLVFGGVPPQVPASETAFRAMHATFLRASATAGNLEALRVLLDSCAQPALIFDSDGRFVAANAASVTALGWSDAVWNARAIGNSMTPGSEALAIQNVLLMQGQWATSTGMVMAATAR